MRIELPSGCPAELVLTEGASTGIVIATDLWGLRGLFEDMAGRLASERGWSVCVPEPFPGRRLGAEDGDGRNAAMTELRDEDVVGNLVAAADATGCARTAVIGFCMGGMYAYKAAGAGRFDRAVAFYGMIRVPDRFHGPGQGEPLDALSRLGATRVLGVCGGRDPFTPPEDVAALRAVAGVTVVEYPEGEHGFVHDPSRPTHRPADASDAWSRAIAFIDDDESVSGRGSRAGRGR